MNHTQKIMKVLSPNDTGETGSHQAGIAIPKRADFITFFPTLPDTKNPHYYIRFRDPQGAKWEFRFIYYNNRLYGGTRNEYRLTGTSKYTKTNRLKSGDTIVLERDDDDSYFVDFYRNGSKKPHEDGTIVLGSTWSIIKI